MPAVVAVYLGEEGWSVIERLQAWGSNLSLAMRRCVLGKPLGAYLPLEPSCLLAVVAQHTDLHTKPKMVQLSSRTSSAEVNRTSAPKR